MSILKSLLTTKTLKLFVFSVLAMTMVLIPEIAYAEATSWAGVAKEGATTLNAFKKLIVIGAYLFGTGLFVAGLWLIYKDGKEENRGHMKNGVTALIIGSLLLVFPSAVGWTTGSLGADAPATENFKDKF